jgi:hypothetical protein
LLAATTKLYEIKTMANCTCKKNQTSSEVHDYLQNLNIGQQEAVNSESGTGLFLVPNPEAGILEVKVVLVSNISYSECSKRGENCIAYKWIPHGYMTESEVRDERLICEGFCPPGRSCGRGCMCYGELCM